MFAHFKAPDIRHIPPIEFLPKGEKQEGGALMTLIAASSTFALHWGISLQAILRYGFGSRYFTTRRILFAALALLLLIFIHNLYSATAAVWAGWAIEGNLINYVIGVVVVLSLLSGLRSLFFLFLLWLGYMLLIAGANPLTLLIKAVDDFFNLPTLTAVAVLVGAMSLHRSLAAYWERVLPKEKHIHTHYYGRSIFWQLYPSDTVNTLLMEPALLLGVYFVLTRVAPELAFYGAVLGVSAFLLSLYAWHVSHRYYQNLNDGKRYSTDQLTDTEQDGTTPPPTNPESVPVAGVLKKSKP